MCPGSLGLISFNAALTFLTAFSFMTPKKKMVSYVSKKLTGEPDWAKASFGYLSGSEHYIQRLFQDYFREASKKLEEQENAMQEDDLRKLVAENVNKAVEKKDRKFFRVLAEVAVPPEGQH